jgi:hypothetical protein
MKPYVLAAAMGNLIGVVLEGKRRRHEEEAGEAEVEKVTPRHQTTDADYNGLLARFDLSPHGSRARVRLPQAMKKEKRRERRKQKSKARPECKKKRGTAGFIRGSRQSLIDTVHRLTLRRFRTLVRTRLWSILLRVSVPSSPG